MHNDNEQSKDALGLAERSSHLDNMLPGGTLGAVILDTSWGELSIGTGFTAGERDHIWENRSDLLGLKVTFKYQPYGMKHLPRFPVFKAFRHD